jgi:hypothetical protein
VAALRELVARRCQMVCQLGAVFQLGPTTGALHRAAAVPPLGGEFTNGLLLSFFCVLLRCSVCLTDWSVEGFVFAAAFCSEHTRGTTRGLLGRSVGAAVGRGRRRHVWIWRL